MNTPAGPKSTLWRRVAVVGIPGVCFLAVIVLIYHLATGGSSVPRRMVPEVVQLRIIQPPPPPPPPPPKMVEQPKIREQEFKMDKPLAQKPPTPDSPPALDAKGQGPGDQFGLEGKAGGGDFLGGGDGGGGGSKYGWYAALIQGRAQEALQKQRKLTGAQYRVAVEIWLTADGTPQRVELIDSTGKPELDRLLKATLTEMPRLPDPPPKNMPEPVVMQVTSS